MSSVANTQSSLEEDRRRLYLIVDKVKEHYPTLKDSETFEELTALLQDWYRLALQDEDEQFREQLRHTISTDVRHKLMEFQVTTGHKVNLRIFNAVADNGVPLESLPPMSAFLVLAKRIGGVEADTEVEEAATEPHESTGGTQGGPAAQHAGPSSRDSGFDE